MPFGPVMVQLSSLSLFTPMAQHGNALRKSEASLLPLIPILQLLSFIFSWAPTFAKAIGYLICQLEVCLSQNLSMSLKKSVFFPKHMAFVDINVYNGGNCPALSKHQLFKLLLTCTTVQDILSFCGFINFYAQWIPYITQCIAPLRTLTTGKSDIPINNLTGE